MFTYTGFKFAIIIALIIGAISGFLIGKKYGKGWGITSGIGIFLVSLSAINFCPQCKQMLYKLSTSTNTPSLQKPDR